MKERSNREELSLEEIRKRQDTRNIHLRVREIREECINVFMDPENREDKTLKRGNKEYIKKSKKRVRLYMKSISSDLTDALRENEIFNTFRSEALMDAVDIHIYAFAFREAYQIVTEVLPLLEENPPGKLLTHVTGAHCMAYINKWHIPFLRDAEKIRGHIKEALLTCEHITASELETAVTKPIWISAFREEDVREAHQQAQEERQLSFHIPTLLKDLLLKGAHID